MFRTEINPDPATWKIHYRDPIFSIGSCFASNIGQYLLDHKFDAVVNPFGIVYNPLSAFDLIIRALRLEQPDPAGFVVNQGVVRHYSLHSDISATTRGALLEKYQAALRKASEHLRRAKVLIITFGTASVYRHKELRCIVNNCHKMPSRLFDRYNMEPQHIISQFEVMNEELMRLNPGIQIILTVSPVRHLRDTLPGSQLSKSILRVACDALARAQDNVSYFPSYELMVDDLRDYRFYERDLLHPNEMARDYIWSKFTDTYFDGETHAFLKAWTVVRKRLQHKPFNPGTPQHRAFIHETIDILRKFIYTVDTTDEIKELESQIHG